MRFKDIDEREQINKTTLKYSTWSIDSGEIVNSTIVPILFLRNRDEALYLLEYYTKLALKRDDAYDRLHVFSNDYSRLRNYEIEDRLEEISMVFGWRIISLCPFNGFNSLDSKYDYSDVCCQNVPFKSNLNIFKKILRRLYKIKTKLIFLALFILTLLPEALGWMLN